MTKMSKICYRKRRFPLENIAIIEQVNLVIDLYKRKDTKPTTRKIFNRLVKDSYLEESKKSYKRLVSIIGKARNAGLIGWDDIDGRKQIHQGDIEL